MWPGRARPRLADAGGHVTRAAEGNVGEGRDKGLEGSELSRMLAKAFPSTGEEGVWFL